MAGWSWGKTFSFALLYLFVLVFTWKDIFVALDLKTRIIISLGGAMVIGGLLYIKEPKR